MQSLNCSQVPNFSSVYPPYAPFQSHNYNAQQSDPVYVIQQQFDLPPDYNTLNTVPSQTTLANVRGKAAFDEQSPHSFAVLPATFQGL
jgi:hypothetical protein